MKLSKNASRVSLSVFRILLALVSSNPAAAAPTSGPEIIYGVDNRKDWHQVTSPAYLRLADSTVALVKRSSISTTAGISTIAGGRLGAEMGLCATEPFADQPSGAFCSGSLIGKDLVITAGHCIKNANDCSGTSFVFGYAVRAPGHNPSQVAASEIYQCAEVLHTQADSPGTGRGADFAVIRLDRAVPNHTPLVMRQGTEISAGTPILVIGHPSGIPSKIADGAIVRNTAPAGYFVTNLDTYGGNSGSAVFNASTLEIEGILVRGDTDYVRTQAGCMASKVCADDACRGEDVTKISEVTSILQALQIRLRAEVLSSSVNAAAGTAQIQLKLSNIGSEGSDATLQISAVGEGGGSGSTQAAIPRPGTSSTVTLSMSGLRSAGLVDGGIAATIRVSFSSRQLAQAQTTLRWALNDRVAAELNPRLTQVLALEGRATLGVSIVNRGSSRTTSPLAIVAAGQSFSVPQLAAGARQDLTVPLTGLDPIALLNGMQVSVTMTVQGSAQDPTMQNISLGQVRLAASGDTAGLGLEYFDLLTKGQGMIPSISSRSQQLRSASSFLEQANLEDAKKIRADRSKLYSRSPQRTLLGKIVARAKQADSSAKLQYEELGEKLWGARRTFFAFIFKGKERKAYETLCLELSTSGRF